MQDSYGANYTEKFGSNPETRQKFDCDSWCKPIGGIKKGRIYGFGKGDSALMLVGANTSSSNRSNEAASLVKEALEAKFEEKLLEIEVERKKEREEMEARMKKEKDDMDAKFEAMKKMMFDIVGMSDSPPPQV